jgi:hypothetical protein
MAEDSNVEQAEVPGTWQAAVKQLTGVWEQSVKDLTALHAALLERVVHLEDEHDTLAAPHGPGPGPGWGHGGWGHGPWPWAPPWGYPPPPPPYYPPYPPPPGYYPV